MSRTFLLGVELSDAGAHPAAWRLRTAEAARLFDPQRWVDDTLAAHRSMLDLIRRRFEMLRAQRVTLRKRLERFNITKELTIS